MLRRLLLFLVLLVLALPASRAAAQTSGNGIRLGNALILHLGMGLEFDYDDNVFYTSGNNVGAFEMRLSPGFDLTNRPRQMRRQIEFDLHGGLNYLEYLSSDPLLQQLRQFGVDGNLRLALFPMSAYNFVLFDNYTRTTQPPYTELPYNLDRDSNEAGVRANLSPGGGRLTFNVGYLYGIDYFEPKELQDFDLMYHRFDARGSWRFLPKTAVYISVTEVLNFYQRQPSPTFFHPNSYPLHVEAGIQGLITTKLTVNGWIGYANGFYVSGPNPSSPVGGLTLTWKPTILSTGTLGYQHDFQNSLLGSYDDTDRVFLTWSQLIWRFTGTFRFSYDNQRYNGIEGCNNTTGMCTASPTGETVANRTDNLIPLSLRIEYPFKDWLFGSVGDDLLLNVSNGMLNLGPPSVVPVNYTKDTVYIRLTASY